jgi:hypothetical protein
MLDPDTILIETDADPQDWIMILFKSIMSACCLGSHTVIDFYTEENASLAGSPFQGTEAEAALPPFGPIEGHNWFFLISSQ